VSDGTTTDELTYDDAGRQISRVADPNALYPNGYIWVYNQGGQPISVTGKPLGNADIHISVGYSGPWVGWPTG